MLDKSDLDVVSEILSDIGFAGRKGKYFSFGGKKYSNVDKAIADMDILKRIADRGRSDLFVKLSLDPTSLSYLHKYISTWGIAEINAGGEEGADIAYDKQSSKDQMKILAQKVAVFKTTKVIGSADPGYKKNQGVSLILFNTESRQVMNGNQINLDGILKAKGITRDEAVDSPQVPHVWPVFNPLIPDLKFETTEPAVFGYQKIIALNTAVPPKWMLQASKKVKPGLKGFIGKLVSSLFPEEEDRERVLDWCHYTLVKKNGTVLCLAGARGTGKTTFTEIMSHVVGPQYQEIVSEGVLAGQFNAQFYNKRLIVFDEVALKEHETINKIKSWCGRTISVEKKGEDAFTTENYASMVFLMNDILDLKIQPQERRFSIPAVAEDNLRRKIPEKEISEFYARMNSESQEFLDEVAEFALFLKDRKPKFDPEVPIRGKRYWEVTSMSLTEDKSRIRDFILENAEEGVAIPISVILPNEEGKRPTLGKDKTKGFLADFLYMANYRLGTVVEMTDVGVREYKLPGGKQVGGRDVGGARQRRMWGILPNPELVQYLAETRKGEDLL